jgi:hypothetical protein
MFRESGHMLPGAAGNLKRASRLWKMGAQHLQYMRFITGNRRRMLKTGWALITITWHGLMSLQQSGLYRI